MSLMKIAPGNIPQFKLTATPPIPSPSINQIGWAIESSDGSPVTMTSNENDITGMTATMGIPSSTKIGSTIITWCVYRHADFSETLGGPWKYTVV